MDNQLAVIQQGTLVPFESGDMNRLQAFQKSLNAKPKKVVTEQIGGSTFQHVPIASIEAGLKKYFFGLYKIEIVDYKMVVNEICVHVRISVFHPILREWLAYDGLAAVPVQQDAGKRVDEFMQTKKKDALHKNLPAAYAFAVKNAAKKIGAIFGSELNRKHEDSYQPFNVGGEALNQ
jgi:hypothetical protein